jgi:hypothetical protein
MLITVIGLIVVDAFRSAYGLEGFPLLTVLAIVLFVVFCVGDWAEEALVAYFNKDDDTQAA